MQMKQNCTKKRCCSPGWSVSKCGEFFRFRGYSVPVTPTSKQYPDRDQLTRQDLQCHKNESNVLECPSNATVKCNAWQASCPRPDSLGLYCGGDCTILINMYKGP